MLRKIGQNDKQEEGKAPGGTYLTEDCIERSFSDVTVEWFHVNQMNQKAATQLKYKVMFEKHIFPELGKRRVEGLDELEVNAFLVEKLKNGKGTGKGLSHSYVRTMGVLISSVLNYAISMGYRLPLKNKIVKPPKIKTEISVMRLADQKRLEHCLMFDYSGTAVGIMVALNTGLRIGEVCALKWEDIDLVEKVLHVRHTVSRVGEKPEGASKTMLVIDSPKTKNSYRDIPINSKLFTMLTAAKETSCSDYVVSDKDGFLSPRTFEYRFHRMLLNYGIPDMNFHVLRHTFSTRCIELGVDVKTLSELLGHANVSITLGIYVHSSIELKRMQIEKLSNLENVFS